MGSLHSPLIDSEQPALQESRNTVGPGQQVLSHDSPLSDDFAKIAEFLDSAMAIPVIGRYGAARGRCRASLRPRF